MKEVGQGFSRELSFLEETCVSLRGWIATNDSRGPDAGVELTGASVTVAQNIECRGEPGNAMFDLSVSALARWRDAYATCPLGFPRNTLISNHKRENHKLPVRINEVGREPTMASCTLVRSIMQITSTLFVKEVGNCHQ